MNTGLMIFGWLFIAITFGMVLIPWILGKRDLVSVWNLFLLGSANFVGYDAVQSGRGVYQWGLYPREDYMKFFFGAILFYMVLFAAYYLPKFPRSFAQKRLRTNPPSDPKTLVVASSLAMLMSLWVVFVPQIQGVGQVAVNVGMAATGMIVSFAFMAWLQRPQQAALFSFFLGAFLVAVTISVATSASRRFLLNVMLAMPICLYWLYLRYRPVALTAWPMVIGVIAAFVMLAAYTAIRHRDKGKVAVVDQSSLSKAVETVQMLPSAMTNMASFDAVLGSGAVEASLLAIGFYNRVEPTEPFYTIKWILLNPIPRAYYPDKPEALGTKLPRDLGVWRTGYVNWGPGIIGHCFHEGGYLMCIFYGIFYGLMFRFFDEVLLHQHNNPYVLSILCAVSGQVIALPRGDIALFTMLIFGAIFAGLLLRFIIRIVFGSQTYIVDEHDRSPAEAQAIGHGELPAAGLQGHYV